MTADQYFQQLKQEYLTNYQGDNPYKMDIIFDKNIHKSRLYNFCRRMPKGADLHTHGFATLPVAELIDYLCQHPELVIQMEAGRPGKIINSQIVSPLPEGCLTMQECLDRGVLDLDKCRMLWTAGRPSEEIRLWDWFELLFEKDFALFSTPDLAEDFYKAIFAYYQTIGIKHAELRVLFFGDHTTAMNHGRSILNALNHHRQSDPTFSAKITGCLLKYRHLNHQFDEMLLDNAIYVHEHLKDDMAGGVDFLNSIDLLNEEDSSFRLEEYVDLLRKAKEQHPNLSFTIHAGESLLDNDREIFGALKIGASRIGHGLNLYRYPELKKQLIDKDICLEVCPISNNNLKYCSDLRQHPAKEYFREGIPMVLASDDPSYQENTPLADDFFAAIVCWDLSLEDIKKLCSNSIRYAFLPEKQKNTLIKTWETDWDQFIMSLQ